MVFISILTGIWYIPTGVIIFIEPVQPSGNFLRAMVTSVKVDNEPHFSNPFLIFAEKVVRVLVSNVLEVTNRNLFMPKR